MDGLICPHCGLVPEELFGRTGRAPRPGDVTLCTYCAGVAVFEADGPPRAPTDLELFGLLRSPAGARIAEARAMIAMALIAGDRPRLGGGDAVIDAVVRPEGLLELERPLRAYYEFLLGLHRNPPRGYFYCNRSNESTIVQLVSGCDRRGGNFPVALCQW